MSLLDNFSTSTQKSLLDKFNFTPTKTTTSTPTTTGPNFSGGINLTNSSFGMGGSTTPQFTNTNITPASLVKSATDFVKSVGESSLRAYGAVGALINSIAQSGMSALQGEGFTPISSEFKPEGQFQQELYGTDKPFSLTSSGAEMPFVSENSSLAPLVGFAGVLGDLIPGGASVKATANALKTVNKTDDVLKTLKSFANFSDDVLTDIVPKIVKSSDASEITTLLESGLKRTKELSALSSESGILNKAPSILKTGEASTPAIKPLESSLSYSNSLDESYEYVKELTKAREAERVAETPGFLAKTKSFLSSAKTKLVDFAAPIEDILAKSVKDNKIDLLPSGNIKNQIDRVLRSTTLAGQFAEDGGLVKVIKDAPNIDALDQYLIAKHAIELDARGITTGRDLVKDSNLIKTLGETYEPFAKVVNQYSQKLLDYSTESGLISKETADMLKARYPDYVPFQRVFNELEKADFDYGSKGIANLSKQTIVQKIEGSERAIESPIESLLAKTNDAFKQGEKNIAGKMLAGYESLPNNPFGLTELKAGDKSLHTISFIDNGVKRTFATLPEVANAAKALNVQQMNIVGKIFALPVRVAKLGITGINPSFISANLARDTVGAFINSDKGLRTSIANPVNFVRTLFSALAHDDLYKQMIRAGGGGTSFDLYRNQVTKTVKDIRATRTPARAILHTVTHPSQLLRAMENIVGRSEEFGRLQQFRGTKEAVKGKLGPTEAAIEGARMAREAGVNFARRGEYGNVMGNMWLYLNANIQGTRTFLRALKDKPVQTTTKLVVAGFMPMAAATAWNLSDPERRKIYEDIPDFEKENNIIVIPPNATQDKNGKWNVIKIPVSQNINNLLNMVRRPMEAAHGMDPVGFGEMAKSLIGTVSPVAPDKGSILSSLTPQAIKPSIEAATNQNLFTGFKQVPPSLERLPEDKQVKKDTSATARQIAGQLGVSPIKVQEFIKGTFGGSGVQVLNLVDRVQAELGIISPEDIGGQDVWEAITARFNKAQGGKIESEEYEAKLIADKIKAGIRDDFKKGTYAEVQGLLDSGKKAEADAIVNKMSDEQYEMYKSVRTSERSDHTETTRELLKKDPKAAVEYVRGFRKDEQDRIVNLLTDEEYKIYQKGK